MNFIKELSKLQEKYGLNKINIEIMCNEYYVSIPLNFNKIGNSIDTIISLLNDVKNIDSEFEVKEFPETVEISLFKQIKH